MDIPQSNAIRAPGWRGSRVISALEVLLGAVIVIGHNVFRVVPNEVVILVVVGLISTRLRDGSFAAMGFRRPESWRRVVLIALAAAALRIVLGEFVIDPIGTQYWPESKAPAGSESIAGDLGQAMLWLLLVWSFAAFGEEIVYRGYLLRRTAQSLGGSTAAYWIGCVAVAVLFGYGHYYKGPVGIIDSAVAGLILGAAYLISGRVLWTAILAHGFIDTVAVVAMYFGWDS
jgi:uncharacterized protein